MQSGILPWIAELQGLARVEAARGRQIRVSGVIMWRSAEGPILGNAFLKFDGPASCSRKISPSASCRLPFNVENLMGFDKLLRRGVATDSNVVLGPQCAYVPLRWELRRPRNFMFSATFDF